MNILIFDTETTGLPLFKERSADPRQPHCVQLAHQLVSADGRLFIDARSFIIDNKVESSEEALKVHGITKADAARHGIAPASAFAIYINALKKCDVVVGHNVQFDLRIMRVFAERMKSRTMLDMALQGKKVICTMRYAKPLVKAPLSEKQRARNMTGFKNPKLEEAYKFFFNEDMEDAHDALADVIACRRIFFHMVSLGEIIL